MYFILFYKTVDDYIEKRAPYREEHLRLARQAYDRGEIVMAGAFAGPADGAVFVFKGNNSDTAKAFALNDPYVKNGLITEWIIRPWTVVIGDK